MRGSILPLWVARRLEPRKKWDSVQGASTGAPNTLNEIPFSSLLSTAHKAGKDIFVNKKAPAQTGQSFLTSIALLCGVLLSSVLVLWYLSEPEERLGRAYQSVEEDEPTPHQSTSPSRSPAERSTPRSEPVPAEKIAEQPSFADALDEAINLKDAGAIDESMALLNKMQESDPNNEHLLLERAMLASREKDDPQMAKELLEKILLQNPNHLTAADELYYSYQRLQDVEGGIAAMKNLKENASAGEKAGVDFVLGRLLLESGQVEEGQALLEQAAAAESTNSPFLKEQLAHAYGRTGDYEKARSAWEELAREEIPSYASLNAKTKMAEILEAEGKFDEARKSLQDLLAIDPGHPQGLALLQRLDQRPTANY